MNNKLMTENTPSFDIEVPGFHIHGFTKICGSDDISVTVRFENPCIGLKKTVTLSMREVRSARAFRQKIPPPFAIPDVKPAHQTEMLRYAINQALNRPDTIVGEALPQGFSLINDRLFYVIGDRILPTKKYDERQFQHLAAHNPYQIKFCTTLPSGKRATGENMFDWIRTFCEQGPAQAVLFLCALTPYMKYVLPDVDSVGSIVNAYVAGESGVGKTEQIKLMTGITDAGYGVNLESDMDQILTFLSRSPDRAVLIDDLNLTASANQKAKKVAKLSELIQMTFSAGEISSGEVAVDISNNALLISAEYALPNPSTINRCVLLRIESPFDSEILTYLQNEKGLYAWFVIKFISFLCQYHRQLKKDLEKFCVKETFHISGTEAESEYFGFSRVYRHNKVLRLTAYAVNIFLKTELNNATECDRLYGVLRSGISLCIGDTLKEISKKPISDVVNAFLQSFQEEKLIAKTPKKYFAKEERLFFLYEDQLYFKGEHLARYLSYRLSRTVSAKAISRDLGSANLLSMYGNSYSEKLPSRLKKTYLGKGHFFRIDVKFLCEMLYNYFDCVIYADLPIVRILKERDGK